ncbi:MAG: C39 family peptidase [Catonella sp.]|nr:C39 family peptidase [Catonella sp.]MDY6356574.1 C39 family peptidase [Catonella sp.]
MAKKQKSIVDSIILDRRYDCLEQGGEPNCSAYMTAHLLQHYGIEKDPEDIYNRMERFIDSEAVAPWQVVRYINRVLPENSVPARYSFKVSGKLQDIHTELEHGLPVPVVILYDTESRTFDDLHYVLVTGMDDRKVYMIDSLHDGGRRTYNRTVSLEDFMIMWGLKKAIIPVKLFGIRNLMLTCH